MIWPFEIIQDGGGHHLEFVRIENSTIRSAVPENPTLEPNMKSLNVSRVKSHAPPIESVKEQSNSVNSHESMSGACKKVRKSASRNSSSVKNKKPLIGATVIRSASEKVKRHPTSTCVMPFRATSVVNSASGEVKKQSNAGHDESQASATEINSAFNTDIEPGLYYVHPETGILYQYGEEDAQEYCVGEERAEYFQANAPMVRF